MSLHYGIHTEEDAKEEAVRSRRQKIEAERKVRILDDKVRQTGKDLCALERQIEEKKAREAFEKQRDREYVLYSNKTAALARELDSRIRIDKKMLDQELKLYQQNCQRFNDRREFDLNRPDYIKNAYPARMHDEDPRLTSCGMQIFDGEDLTYKQRMRDQALERKAFLDAQLEEKRQNEDALRKAEGIYNQRVFNTSIRSYELMKAERDAKIAVNKALVDFNLLLAQEQKERNCIMKQAEDEADLAHKLNMTNSELLTETVDATSIGGPHRTTNDRFKGFGRERLAAIKDHQRLQILQHKEQEKEENARETEWAKQVKARDIHCQLYDFSIQKQRRERKTEHEMTNAALSREQRMREEYRNRILYSQIPSEDFFAQFQTSSR